MLLSRKHHKVTRSDIKMLKEANFVTFTSGIRYGAGAVIRENIPLDSMSILCEKRPNNLKDGSWDLVQTGRIFTSLSILGSVKFAIKDVWFAISDADRDPIWQSVMSILKTGDEISVQIQPNIHRPFINDDLDGPECVYRMVNLDTVALKIDRGDKRWEFIIKVKLSDANNPAVRIIS